MEIDLKGKHIKNLREKALKGNFFSAYQLYDFYKSGKFVDQDKDKADQYLELADSLFYPQDFKLSSLSIDNYKLFNDIRITKFDDNLNIFVGANGAGKTTILDAISMSLSWFVNSISKSGGTGTSIDDSDINIYTDLPFANIITTIRINKNIKCKMELSQARDGIQKKRSYLYEVRRIGSFYKISNEINSELNLPLFAFYNALRSYDVSQKDMNISALGLANDSLDKFKGYNNSLNGKVDFSSFVEWFKTIDDIETRRQLSSIDQDFKIANKLLAEIENLIDNDPSSAQKLNELIKSLALKEKLSEVNELSSLNKDNIKLIKKSINLVIEEFMDGYGNLELEMEPRFDLFLTKNERKISVLKLSQGEKALLSLILDITMRLFMLNPSLSNPLHGQGIVLIDEFDLHLHPKWQREIVNKLPTVFPNCQFFLTTHSPLVLGEAKPSQIFIFYNENNVLKFRQPTQSLGLTSNDILNELMITDSNLNQLSRSALVEESLNEIFNLIEQETDDSIFKAKLEIEKLEKMLFGEIPELIEAKTKIEFLEL